MDMLDRAWNVLSELERPVWMDRRSLDGVALWSSGMTLLDEISVSDRLCQAVEEVLHMDEHWSNGYSHLAGKWYWLSHLCSDREREYSDPDRLTAAVLALESERGSDEPAR